jgi:hypothetical protein
MNSDDWALAVLLSILAILWVKTHWTELKDSIIGDEPIYGAGDEKEEIK